MMASTTRPGLVSALRGVSRRITSRQCRSLEHQFRLLSISTPCSSDMALEPIKPGSADIQAAPEIDLVALAKKYRLAEHARTVPASPSYFSKSPKFNDAFVRVEALYRKYGHLPTLPPADVERVAWKRLKDARTDFNERVKATDYVRCLFIVKSLHSIHPDLKPAEVTEALQVFKRDIQGFLNKPKPVPIDKYGRALGVGKRKASTARAYVLEGNGEVLINGKTLAEYFGRVHDRETAIWPLTATDRIDKYNVWVRVEGGGTTGQADAIKLAIAKGLLAHEPALKPALRRAGCITRDPRTVERKKPGRKKARKGLTWVKR